MTQEDLVALFINRATVPLTEDNRLLLRHLKCKDSLRLSDALANAMNDSGNSKGPKLPAPSDLLAPLA
jgi:hypothetical protein